MKSDIERPTAYIKRALSQEFEGLDYKITARQRNGFKVDITYRDGPNIAIVRSFISKVEQQKKCRVNITRIGGY